MATPDSPLSFNFSMNQPLSGVGPTPHSPLHIAAAHAALRAAPADVKRKVVARWLKGNIASLVGPDAANAMEALLNTVDSPHVDTFVGHVLDHRMNLER